MCSREKQVQSKYLLIYNKVTSSHRDMSSVLILHTQWLVASQTEPLGGTKAYLVSQRPLLCFAANRQSAESQRAMRKWLYCNPLCWLQARTKSHLLLIKILFCQVRQTPLWKTANKMIQIKSFKSKPLQDQCSPSGFEANTGSQSGLPGTETNDPWCWKSVTPRQSVNVQVVYYLASRSRAVLYLKSDPCPGQPLWLHLSALMSPKASIFHSRYLWATFDIKCLSLIKVILPPAFDMCNLQICSFHDKYHERWLFA